MYVGDIIKMVGRKTGIMDANDQIVDSVVTKKALFDFLNMRYRQIFMEMAERFPHTFATIAMRDLVTDKKTYVIGGHAHDALHILYVGVKYNPSDQFYTRARRIEFDKAFEHQINPDVFSKSDPRYILDTLRQPSEIERPYRHKLLKPAITLLPIPDTDVENGLMIRYVETPRRLKNMQETIYNLPERAQDALALFVIADVWEAKGDWSRSERALNRAKITLYDFFNTYQPTSADEVIRFTPNRRYNPLRRR